MTVEYRVLMYTEYNELVPVPKELPSSYSCDEDARHGACCCGGFSIVQFRDGKPVELVGTDPRGELEDQTFGRDLSWVAEALADAYDEGLRDGEARSLPRPALRK